MNIGITTYFNIKNYGSALQAFAMRHFLTQNGHTALFLNVKEQQSVHKLLHKLHVGAVTAAKCALSKEARQTQQEIRRLKRETTTVITPRTVELFDSFEKNFLPSVSIGRIALKKRAASNEFGAFICGSDQIWSPLSAHLSGFKFLNFAPKAKRIAYAPSFGVSKIPSYNRAFIKKQLTGITDISVRELQGAEMVKELTGRDVPVVLDPTMLHTGEQWRSLYQANTAPADGSDYILCYFFDEPSEEIVAKICRFAADKQLQVRVLVASNKAFLEKGAVLVDAGPMEFLQLIDNARYVFTNSFHGCVFSVLFEKEFIAFGRNHSNAVKQTSRIETLLQRIGAEESFYKDGQDAFIFPNTQGFHDAIAPLRAASSDYLTNCLKKRDSK